MGAKHLRRRPPGQRLHGRLPGRRCSGRRFGNDTVIGWAGADMLFGNEGSDLVVGNYDPDLLIGGQGFDTLYGGKDNDTLYGNQGVNELLGGSGADIFAMVPGVRLEHEERPVLVLVGYHEETVATFTTEIVDPPPHQEQETVREDAPGRPDESASQQAWDNYAQRSIANGYTLVEYAPTDIQQLFPNYYREETRTITVDPPPFTIEVEHITTVQVPDYEVQYITVDRTLLAFDGLAVIADFTPGLDHLSITGPEVAADVAYGVTARDLRMRERTSPCCWAIQRKSTAPVGGLSEGASPRSNRPRTRDGP